jgi:hypothetical protein
MPLFKQLSDKEIRNEFVYYGFLFGVVPVYVGRLQNDSPVISTRNWVPEFWMDLWEGLFAAFVFFATAINRGYDPSYPIMITARIDGQELE